MIINFQINYQKISKTRVIKIMITIQLTQETKQQLSTNLEGGLLALEAGKTSK